KLASYQLHRCIFGVKSLLVLDLALESFCSFDFYVNSHSSYIIFYEWIGLGMQHQLDFKHICFQYPNSQASLFKELNFSVKTGELV
ncbi:hypothetical protein ABXW85_19830, partial [Streptococcus suis]